MRRNGSGASRMLRRSECPPKTARREHRAAQPRQQPSGPPRHSGRWARGRRGAHRFARAARRTRAGAGGHAPALGALAVVQRARAGARGARRGAARDPHDLAARAAHGQPHLARSRRPGAHGVGGRVGRPRDAAQPAPHLRCERLLPPSAEPRVLGLAARLRPDRADRVGHRRRTGPLQPAVPVRVRAVRVRRLPAGARDRAGQAGRGRCGDRVRLRALPGHRGRPSARDLLGRHPAGVVPVAARVPAQLGSDRDRGLARVRLAGEPRLHARPPVRLPAGDPRRDRRDRLVAGYPAWSTSPARW